MKKVIWSIVLSWVCLAFAAGIGTRDAEDIYDAERESGWSRGGDR